MANNMQVSLDTTQSPYRLSVKDSGGENQVSQNPNPQTISFSLTGVLAQGNFVPMTAAEPGFSWIDPPPAGVFSLATVTNNGNGLQFTDSHADSSSNGQWIYMLRVSYNGSIYCTTNVIQGPGGTINNPIIINKGP